MSAIVPHVSVGLPVFNGGPYLEEAINSLLTQTFEDFELIISDNGSTDGTEEICRRYASRDKRVKYFRSATNHGLSWNFRRVFELSSGEYFMWMSHDDTCAPELLGRCVEILDATPSAIVSYSRMNLIDEDGNTVRHHEVDLHSSAALASERLYHHLRPDHYTPQFHGLFRADYLRMAPDFGNYVHSDMTLIARLLLLGRFYEIREYLFNYRVHHDQSLSRDRYLLTEWIDPTKNGRISLPQWRIFWELWGCVREAPLSHVERLRCCVHVLRWPLWNRNGKRMARDVIVACLQLVGSSVRFTRGRRLNVPAQQVAAARSDAIQHAAADRDAVENRDPLGVA